MSLNKGAKEVKVSWSVTQCDYLTYTVYVFIKGPSGTDYKQRLQMKERRSVMRAVISITLTGIFVLGLSLVLRSHDEARAGVTAGPAQPTTVTPMEEEAAKPATAAPRRSAEPAAPAGRVLTPELGRSDQERGPSPPAAGDRRQRHPGRQCAREGVVGAIPDVEIARVGALDCPPQSGLAIERPPEHSLRRSLVWLPGANPLQNHSLHSG